jgi:hypothetical protein
MVPKNIGDNPLKDCVYMEWKNRIWAASLDFILFLNILNFFVNMRLGIRFVEVQIL